jgi:hypothetical protein
MSVTARLDGTNSDLGYHWVSINVHFLVTAFCVCDSEGACERSGVNSACGGNIFGGDASDYSGGSESGCQWALFFTTFDSCSDHFPPALFPENHQNL